MERQGEIHPVVTTATRAERATLRAARELARREAERDPASLNLDDGLALSPATLERLTSCHRKTYRKLDWRELAKREPVCLPVRTHERERAARRALGTWQPSWQDRIFADEALRRRQLTEKVMEAARDDEREFQKVYRAAAAHNTEVLAARQLLALDPKSIKEVVTTKTSLGELRESMNGLGVALPGARRVVAHVQAIQEEDLPHERLVEGDRRVRRRAGIPPAERRRLHLTAVCSVGLRVGAELVAVLPVDAVEVVVSCEPAGLQRAEPEPVMQLLVTAKSLTAQAWGSTDAIALATALRTRWDWSIERGFAPIQLVDLTSQRSAAA